MANKSPGRPKNPPTARKILKDILPIKDIFTEEELVIYESLVDIYMKDFDEEDLSSVDIDDIMTIAINKVLEVRLLKSSISEGNITDPDRLIDISASVEKLRKQTDKVKENLSVRRKDRIDPNEFKGFSIVDLAAAFDNEKKYRMERKALLMKAEQKKVAEALTKYPGNRFDVDNVKKEDVEF